MTREDLVKQKAHNLGQEYFPDKNNVWARPNFEAQYVSEACIRMAEWGDDNPNWIRPIDEMPPIGENVLTRVIKGDGSVVYQVDRRASSEWVNLCHYDKVTHWMRIKFNEEDEL